MARTDEWRRDNARRSADKRAWENAHDRPTCACGATMGVGAHRKGATICSGCSYEAGAVGKALRRERIYELWHAGASLRDIAEAGHGRTPAAVGVTITGMRQDGWDMPYRRTPRGKP